MPYLIYRVINTINTKIYIGVTTNSLKQRWKEHLREVKAKTSKPLYVDMSQYGIEHFTIELLEECSDEQNMYKREIQLIKSLNTIHPNGYNIRGKQLTDEQAAVIKFNVFRWTAKQYAEYFGLSVPSIRRVTSCWGPFNHITKEHLPQEFQER